MYLLKLVIFVLFLFVFFVLYPFTLHKHYMWLWTTKPVIRSNVFFFYTSSESWWSNLSIYMRYNYLKMESKFQMKFLCTMHITNLKWSFDIFIVGNLLNIFMEHDLYFNIVMIFDIKEKSIILTLQCIVGYCSTKYTCATYEWFCASGSRINKHAMSSSEHE